MLVAILLAISGGFSVLNAGAQNSQTEIKRPEKRSLLLERPGNHPIKIKDIRNYETENFLQDFEIEVQNISEKSIYFFRIAIGFPDIPGSGNRGIYGFSLVYGRTELFDFNHLSNPEDKPFNPNEKMVLRIPDDLRKPLENYLSRNNIPVSAMDRVEISVQEVNFGDGTGFQFGKPFPIKKTSETNRAPKTYEIVYKDGKTWRKN